MCSMLYYAVKYAKAQALAEVAHLWQRMPDSRTSAIGHGNACSRLWKLTTWRFTGRSLTVVSWLREATGSVRMTPFSASPPQVRSGIKFNSHGSWGMSHPIRMMLTQHLGGSERMSLAVSQWWGPHKRKEACAITDVLESSPSMGVTTARFWPQHCLTGTQRRLWDQGNWHPMGANC